MMSYPQIMAFWLKQVASIWLMQVANVCESLWHAEVLEIAQVHNTSVEPPWCCQSCAQAPHFWTAMQACSLTQAQHSESVVVGEQQKRLGLCLASQPEQKEAAWDYPGGNSRSCLCLGSCDCFNNTRGRTSCQKTHLLTVGSCRRQTVQPARLWSNCDRKQLQATLSCPS